MSNTEDGLILGPRFTQAVDYARTLHTEFRKGTHIPYLAHLLGVASLVLSEADGRIRVTEDMVIAALLHDTVEDHGGLPRLHEVKSLFGPDVARMVAGLSDTFAEDHNRKEGWEDRKAAYITRLRAETDDVLLISAADKLYNAKSILDAYREIGDAVFDRFHRGANQQLWYLDQLLSVFCEHPRNGLVDELERVIGQLKVEMRSPSGA